MVNYNIIAEIPLDPAIYDPLVISTSEGNSKVTQAGRGLLYSPTSSSHSPSPVNPASETPPDTPLLDDSFFDKVLGQLQTKEDLFNVLSSSGDSSHPLPLVNKNSAVDASSPAPLSLTRIHRYNPISRCRRYWACWQEAVPYAERN